MGGLAEIGGTRRLVDRYRECDSIGDNMKVAIITGAGRGIGREEAIELGRSGFAVVVNDVDADVACETVADVESEGGVAREAIGDVSASGFAERLVNGAVKEYGRLDVVVNNAGVLRDRMIFNMTGDEWRDVIKVHLDGTFYLTRSASSHWRSKSKSEGRKVEGRIINTTSRSGLFGNPGQCNYGAAKAGIATLTRIVAREVKKYGISCNAIAPRAYTRTMKEAFGALDPEEYEEWSPEWIARFVGLLATSEQNDVSGQVFIIRGSNVDLLEPWSVAAHAEMSGPISVQSEKRSGEKLFEELFNGRTRSIEDYDPSSDLPLIRG